MNEILRLKEEIELLKKLVKKYKFDFLTGLMQRIDFDEKLSEFLNNQIINGNNNFYLVLVDLNNLHKINREKGYLEGDKFIKEISEKLVKIFSFDNVYRIGGDEFAILLKDIDEEKIKEKLKNIKNITFGIINSKNKIKANELFKEADKILVKYKKKRNNNGNL